MARRAAVRSYTPRNIPAADLPRTNAGDFEISKVLITVEVDSSWFESSPGSHLYFQ
jgi:hypothetical protein